MHQILSVVLSKMVRDDRSISLEEAHFRLSKVSASAIGIDNLGTLEPGKRMSSAVIHGNKVYLAGFTPDKALGKSVAEQTKDVLTQIDATLAKAGYTPDELGEALAKYARYGGGYLPNE